MATSSIPAAPLWETLRTTETFSLSRSGRYLRAELLCPHLTISTSSRNGGQHSALRYLVNHQSCEAKNHTERHEVIKEFGLEAYHNRVCEEIGVNPESAAVMGTAANMNYAGIVTHRDGDLAVTAVVTAGVSGNAACAGDPAGWRESKGNWEQAHPHTGTINTMLLIHQDVTDGALARAILTMCEAKSAALTRLAIGSLYSQDTATGTGTDQFCVAAAMRGETPLTSASPHVMLGQLIGTSVRDATLEALRWQNGLEPSYTRGVFHALGRYGVEESSVFEGLQPLLGERSLALLRQNSKAIFYEPMVGAAAYAIAAVLDRVRYQTLPSSIAREALRHQAACLAVALSAKPSAWAAFYTALPEPDLEKPATLVLAAIAKGWESKWT